MIPEVEHLSALLTEWGAETIHLHRGDTLICQGDVAEDFYVVRRGRLRAIYNHGEEGERVVGEAARGEPVGEMALLGDGTRTASVIAVRDSELTPAKVVIHREGPLAKWVGASMTVPGFAPPLVEDGDLLVDGGLLNNLPADVAREDGSGLVIAVDVSPKVDLRVTSDFSGRPGVPDVVRLWFAAKREPGAVRPFPGLFTILNRATTLSGVRHKESLKKMTDVYLKMPVSDCRIFEWKRLDELVEIGYQTALEQLGECDLRRSHAGGREANAPKQ